MAVWYLDNDDEITDAVARMRDTGDEHVVFVVPPGSRIATGRINFRLLAREAGQRDLGLAIASPDEQVRALATSAGVLSAATPDAAEAALERGDPPPDPTPDVETAPAAETRPAMGVEGGFWNRGRVTVATLVVLGLAVVGGYVGLETLPTAEITVVPRSAVLGPITVEVVADPAVEAVDPERGRIPAVELAIPLAVAGTFEASGTETEEVRATGSVVFESARQEFDQAIVAGTRLRTPGGIEFQTTESVTLPRSPDRTASSMAVAIEAVSAGPGGNVEAGAISVVPSLESQDIRVTNPEPTVGGLVETHPVVTAQDYDAAAVDLQNRLAGALAAYLREPADVPPELQLFPETARQGAVQLDPPASEVVGAGLDAFELAATSSATTVAVDPRLALEVIGARVQAAAPTGTRLVPETLRVEVADGVVEAAAIRFIGTGEARVSEIIDPAALAEQVAGLPIPEARAILADVGSTTVNVWPEFVSELPDDLARISVEVQEPSATE
jgi:hypothetical protein